MSGTRYARPAAPASDADGGAGTQRRAPRSGWIVAGLVLGGVIFLTLGPDLIPGLGSGLLDRSVHAAAYGVAMAAVLLARIRPMGGLTRRAWIEPLVWALALAILGAALEVAQVVGGRDTDAVDALANAAGIGIVLLLWWLHLVVRWIGRSRWIGHSI